MQEIFNFIKEYWQVILSSLVFIGSFVLALARKRPVRLLDTIKGSLMRMLPDLVAEAEEQIGPGKGSEKMNYVLSLCEYYLMNNYGLDKVTLDQYLYFVSSFVEEILSAPSKKGG